MEIKQVTLTANHEAVIPTGPYQNQRFGFGISEVIDTSGDGVDSDELRKRHKFLGERVYNLFKEAEGEAIRERIENERKDFRFYKLPSGKVVPSVTSILNFDKDFGIPITELAQYASWGTILHAQVSEYWKTGTWKRPEDIDGLYADFVIVKKGSLMLDLTGIDFKAFLEKYPIECKAFDIQVFNDEHDYAGTIDFWGNYEGQATMFDCKRTPEKEHFLQTAAYAKAEPFKTDVLWPEKFEQMALIGLQAKTQQGFSKPMISDQIDRAFDLFLAKRKKFKARYGL